MTEHDDHRVAVQDGLAECACGWRAYSVLQDPRLLAAWHRLSSQETVDNPYLREFLAPVTEEEVARSHGSEDLARHARRDRLVAEYAWAIPTEVVLRRIAQLSPICDLGCGTGYWARLLRDVGAGVVAVDQTPPLEGENYWHRRRAQITLQPNNIRHFVEITRGGAATLDVPP